MIRLEEYRDMNIYVKTNDVETSDNRFSLFDMPQNYKYLDSSSGSFWVGKSDTWNRVISRDNGATFKNETQLILYGTFFFIADEIGYQSRSVYSILMVISDFGGFIDVSTFVFMIICTTFNERQLVAKSVRSLFFHNLQTKKDKNN